MKNCILVILIASMILLFGSCLGSIEINELAAVMGMAVDKGSKDNYYKVTAQLAKASDLKTDGEDSGGGSKNNAYVNIANEGKGIHAPLQNLTLKLSRKLYTGHNQVIIISKEVAENDISSILDFFIRNSQGRFSITLLISEEKASEILEEDAELEPLPAIHLQNLMEAQHWLSFVEKKNMRDFLSDMMSKTTAPTIPIIGLEEKGSEKKRAVLRGSAVFDGASIAGVLTPLQSRVVLLLKDKVKDGPLEVETEDGYLSLEIMSSKTHINPIYENGKFKIKVEIKQNCAVADSTVKKDYVSKNTIQLIENLAQESTIKAVKDVIKYTQDLNSDVFGFGQCIFRKYPKQSKEVLDNWDEEFANLDVEIDIDVDIINTGSILLPLMPHYDNAQKESEYVGNQ